jgi:hypothetical protein
LDSLCPTLSLKLNQKKSKIMNETQNTSEANTSPTAAFTATFTHVGKIGRLPQSIRDQLGHRIEDGRPGTEIVQWLNEQLQVKVVLAEFFGARPINEQNLSDWRQSGHQNWLRHQNAAAAVQSLLESSGDLEKASGQRGICDRFAIVLAVEMTQTALALLAAETDLEKRWKRLCEIQRQLSQLRRDDHRSAQIAQRRDHQLPIETRLQTQEPDQRKSNGKDQPVNQSLAGLFVEDALDKYCPAPDKPGQFCPPLTGGAFGPHQRPSPARGPGQDKPLSNGHPLKPNKA